MIISEPSKLVWLSISAFVRPHHFFDVQFYNTRGGLSSYEKAPYMMPIAGFRAAQRQPVLADAYIGGSIWRFPKSWEYPQPIHFKPIFHDKPSSHWCTPHFRAVPFLFDWHYPAKSNLLLGQTWTCHSERWNLYCNGLQFWPKKINR